MMKSKKLDKENETSLIGTWISVGVVGAVILIVYIIVFGLYMARV
ncbi:cytochrome c oxidase subunit 2A [Paenisporosarcina sp. TG-14]|nr:cytochrome c oxidase subunit 2A [Paenisporosarcina sp. TG-14]